MSALGVRFALLSEKRSRVRAIVVAWWIDCSTVVSAECTGNFGAKVHFIRSANAFDADQRGGCFELMRRSRIKGHPTKRENMTVVD